MNILDRKLLHLLLKKILKESITKHHLDLIETQ